MNLSSYVKNINPPEGDYHTDYLRVFLQRPESTEAIVDVFSLFKSLYESVKNHKISAIYFYLDEGRVEEYDEDFIDTVIAHVYFDEDSDIVVDDYDSTEVLADGSGHYIYIEKDTY